MHAIPARTLHVLGAATVISTVAMCAPAHAYQVKPGDTVWDLARRYHTSVAAIISRNGLRGGGFRVHPGQRLSIPLLSTGHRSRHSGGSVGYTVRRGDTLWGIARRYHTTAQAIAARTGLANAARIRPGDRLLIPVVARNPAHASRAARPAIPGRTLRAPVSALISRTATALRVDPGLALAVGWQESGWKQATRSPAGAVGVMQVLPTTGRWISAVTGRRLDLAAVTDNVYAGVWYLRYLTRRTSSASAAIGAYYQGLGSVGQRGLTPGTRRYVTSVQALQRRLGSNA